MATVQSRIVRATDLADGRRRVVEEHVVDGAAQMRTYVAEPETDIDAVLSEAGQRAKVYAEEKADPPVEILDAEAARLNAEAAALTAKAQELAAQSAAKGAKGG